MRSASRAAGTAPRQDDELHVLHSCEPEFELGLDLVAPLVHWQGRAVVSAEPHVVGLKTTSGWDEAVFGGQDVPAVAGLLGVGGGFRKQLETDSS